MFEQPSSSARDAYATVLLKSWLSGGLANAAATTVLNPFDVAKTRMQCSLGSRATLRQTLQAVYRERGLAGLWTPGLAASCAREMLSSGPRAGFYIPVRDGCLRLLDRPSDGDLLCKVAAAMACGTLGSVIANPVDVVKIRLMVDPQRYPSLGAALLAVYRTEGLGGLYRGLLPSTLRSAFVAAGELAAYDIIKTQLRSRLRRDDWTLHLLSSLLTGVVAALVAAPFDLLKARAMNGGALHSLHETVRGIVRSEGWTALYRGVLPAYLRLGPHALLCFPLLEQLRHAFGLPYI